MLCRYFKISSEKSLLMFSRRTLLIAFSLFLPLCVAVTLSGSDASKLGALPTSLNVKDFGAIGDGITDDTAALQAAADKALEIESERRDSLKLRVGLARGLSNGSKASIYPEIYFPEGRYLIHRTILFQQSALLRGSGNATIIQKNPDQDIFYFHYAYRYAVEGLIFEGGKIQVHFWTRNMAARLRVKNCVFRNASSYALECTSYTKEKLEGEDWNKSKPWPPYLVENNILIPQPPDDLKLWYNSTLLMVEDCRFENCMKVADVACDLTAFQNLDVDAHPNMEGGAFRNRGQMRVDGLRGMAHPDGKKASYWFEGDGDFDLRNMHLDTDTDTGMSLIYSSVSPGTTIRKVRVEDSEIKSAGSNAHAIIYIRKGTMPNIITLSNVREISSSPTKAIAWESVPTEEELNTLKFFKNTPIKNQFAIVVENPNGNIDSTLPESLASLKDAPIPMEALQATLIKSREWEGNDMDQSGWTLMDARTYGVDPRRTDDQTEAIQKVFDAAANVSLPMVLFPGAAVYKVSETIRLPEKIAVRVVGSSLFVQTNKEKSFFEARQAKELIFKNCDFMGGRHAVEIAPDTKGRILFDYCSFYDQQGAAIQCLAEESNQAHLLIRASIFRTEQALVTNVDHSQIYGFWGISDPHLNDAAFIENRGGKMLVRWMLGNPTIWRGKRSKNKTIQNWNYSHNVRWIDNWGHLYCQGNRFGGESGGMCSVFNRSPEGTVYIGGGFARYNNPEASKPSLIFVEKTPKTIVVDSVSCIPGTSLILYSDGQSPGSIYTSGTFAK